MCMVSMVTWRILALAGCLGDPGPLMWQMHRPEINSQFQALCYRGPGEAKMPSGSARMGHTLPVGLLWGCLWAQFALTNPTLSDVRGKICQVPSLYISLRIIGFSQEEPLEPIQVHSLTRPHHLKSSRSDLFKLKN